MYERRSNEQRSRDTRDALVRAARTMFAERGYRATSLVEIAEAAEVTTGAVYHHWPGKRGLLTDIVVSFNRELTRDVARRLPAQAPPLARIRIAAELFLHLCAEPGVGRLLVLDAPSALGLEAWLAIDERWWLRPTEQALTAAGVPAADSRWTAAAFLGALTALGREVARDPGPDTVGHAIGRIGPLLATMAPGQPG